MNIQITAFRWVPEFAQGYVRDLRLRWALEEAGLPYEVVLVDSTVLASPEHRQWQPFGQVPAYRDDTVEMFETGAILLHLAAKSEILAPRDPAGRAKVASWVVAALNSIEPHAQTLVNLDTFFAGQAWTTERRPSARALLDQRLASLSAWLADKDYLEGTFTAGDIAMHTVLRELVDCKALLPFPNLEAYRARCESRPAFARAMEGQMATFRENAP
jgi:glutathione S-transferase